MITFAIAIFLLLLCYNIVSRTVFINTCTFKVKKHSKIKKFYILLFLINLLLFLFSNTIYCIIGCSALIVIWIINNILCTYCNKQYKNDDEKHQCNNCIAVRLKHKNIFDKIILFILKWINEIKKVK
jgi:hypothetical protein